MIRAYAVPDVREVEDAAMARLPEGALMARAARALADVAAARLRERGGSTVVALVGGGNNGGDALYAAAHLAEAGFTVGAVTTQGPVHDGGAKAAAHAGTRLVSAGDGRWRALLAGADLVLDGITGIGGRPGLREEARGWVAAIPPAAYVVAVDLPSGADPAGEVRSADAVQADETVTFGAAKPVHLLPPGAGTTGRLTVVDIGLDFTGRTPAVEQLTPGDVPDLWPVPTAADDKYTRGVVGLVTGSTAYPGAGVLSALGALGAGPGMVRYLGPPEVATLVHHQAPEVVTAAGRVQAWALGSGIDPNASGSTDQVARIREVLDSDLPALVDAGGLDLVPRRDAPTLLTPHAGELARLLERLGLRPEAPSREAVTDGPVAAARAVADHLQAAVLLKGAVTVVVEPSARGTPVRSAAAAPPWLATAGAGDVLGGLVATLLAQGLAPLDAGSLGALVHGVAAHRCNPGGPVRVRALAETLPATVAALLAGHASGAPGAGTG